MSVCPNTDCTPAYGGVPDAGRTECLKFILAYFQPIRIEYSEISGKSRKFQSKQINSGHYC